MGYSYSVRLPDADARDRWLAFLSDHFRPAYTFGSFGPDSEQAGYDDTRTLGASENLGYEDYPFAIGFSTTAASGSTGQYMRCMLRWIALRGGQLERFELLDRPVPCYHCDGDSETIPVIATENDPDPFVENNILFERFSPGDSVEYKRGRFVRVVDVHGFSRFQNTMPAFETVINSIGTVLGALGGTGKKGLIGELFHSRDAQKDIHDELKRLSQAHRVWYE